MKVAASGQWRAVADVAAFEERHNPDGQLPDANPYGVLAEPGRQYVVDAGGNTLLEVRANGTVSLVAVLSPIAVPPGPFNPPFASSDAVPTQVRRGPDGTLYVSTLTGAPFLPGLAGIYRVVRGEVPQLHAGGFTQITDLEWGTDGNLYVLQYASAPFFGGPGALIRVAPDGTRTSSSPAPRAIRRGLRSGPMERCMSRTIARFPAAARFSGSSHERKRKRRLSSRVAASDC